MKEPKRIANVTCTCGWDIYDPAMSEDEFFAKYQEHIKQEHADGSPNHLQITFEVTHGS